MATRWGIVSAGKVSLTFCTVMKSLPAAEHQVVAVAARNLDRAQSFADEFGIPKANGSYEELAKDPDVEIAYVGTINSEHYTACKLMLEHGKHVLCEKAMTLNTETCQDLLQLAKQKKLFFLEGHWSRFFPAYQTIRETMTSGAIGDVLLVRAMFGAGNQHVDRIHQYSLGGGGLHDIGCYVLQLAMMVFDEKPIRVMCAGDLMETGVDSNACITLCYGRGRYAQLIYDCRVSADNSAEIIGTTGNIRIPAPFWCPTRVITPNGEQTFELTDNQSKYMWPNMEGLKYEIAAVRECIKAGKLESELMPHEHSLILSEVMDEIGKQLGVQF